MFKKTCFCHLNLGITLDEKRSCCAFSCWHALHIFTWSWCYVGECCNVTIYTLAGTLNKTYQIWLNVNHHQDIQYHYVISDISFKYALWTAILGWGVWIRYGYFVKIYTFSTNKLFDWVYIRYSSKCMENSKYYYCAMKVIHCRVLLLARVTVIIVTLLQPPRLRGDITYIT